MKLYTYAGAPKAYKALIAAQYNGVSIEVPKFEMGKDNKSASFLKMNPLGKVPVLETDKGAVFESNAIARYVARLRADTELYGRNFFESGKVDQWIDFSANELDMPVSALAYPILGFMEYNKATADKAQDSLKKALKVLNDHLLHNTFLVGNKVTLADIVVSCSLFLGYKLVFDPAFRKPFGNVNRWFTTIINQPQFLAVAGQVTLCEKAAQPKGGKGGKAASPKKEAKAAPAPAQPEKKPEPVDKLKDLPPSKMVMDAWKRCYSNEETREKALPWFFENYDPEGYSLWYCKYKYCDELNRSFMSSNLVGGWFQRLDRVRKYAFGCVLILGEEGPGKQTIEGVWCFRGTEIPDQMLASDDSELYDWSKMDLKKDKKKIEDFWAWDVPINKKEVLDGKVFK